MKQPLTASRERAALWLSSVVITVVVLLQDNGRIVPETKLDVVLDPWTMASRSLSAWDPSAGFGRVQNQAIGYLFPMGMWNMIGDAVSSPPWLTQRLWLAGIVVISMWGAHRVATAAGISTAGGRISSALVYALAPATISVTFFQSAGQLPYALIPHVLAELMAARQGDSQRRVAARSTLWLVAMGGVNAASVAAVVPLVGVWFWSREQGSDRRRLAGWWILGAVLGSLWWAIPLVVTVRYGIRFTDFTETASTTTITESATEILRGTGHWLPYLDTSARHRRNYRNRSGGPSWVGSKRFTTKKMDHHEPPTWGNGHGDRLGQHWWRPVCRSCPRSTRWPICSVAQRSEVRCGCEVALGHRFRAHGGSGHFDHQVRPSHRPSRLERPSKRATAGLECSSSWRVVGDRRSSPSS